MIVVADTSPVSNLIVIQQLDLLHSLFGNILVPQRVFDEIKQLENFGIDASQLTNADWVLVKNLDDFSLYNTLVVALDKGESEAIALSMNYPDCLLLIDEKKGRRVAESYNISCIGLLGVLLLAKKKGLIKFLKPLMDDLIEKANFFVSAKVYQSALSAANEGIK